MPGLANLRGALAGHRKQILLGGAAVAAALGVAHAHKMNSTAAGASTAAAGTVDPTTGASIAGYAPASDTTGTDVYNALQPQLEQNQNMLETLLTAISKIPKSIPLVAPKPAAKPKPKPKPKPKKHHKKAPVKKAAPARRVAAPAPHKAARDTTYVARKSDTVSSVAARTNTNVAALAGVNRGITARPLAAGTVVTIPNPTIRRA
ncbi:MAG: hypothetical protein JWQ32_2072 [Marmoricola sp.]|nr:hypothetical protein [Marmoricola sp.]